MLEISPGSSKVFPIGTSVGVEHVDEDLSPLPLNPTIGHIPYIHGTKGESWPSPTHPATCTTEVERQESGREHRIFNLQ